MASPVSGEVNEHRRAARLLAIVAVLAVLLQVAIVAYRGVQPTDASAAAASAAVGWFHGRGLTVSPEEASRAWGEAGRPFVSHDLAGTYLPGSARRPMHYPLPALSLLMIAMVALTGRLWYEPLVLLQIAAHVGLGLAFAAELMRRDRWLGALSGAAWLLFVPFYRLNLPPTYDAWTSHATMALVTASLCYIRTRRTRAVLALGFAAAFGIWMREYFVVLPCLLGLALVYPVRAAARHVALYAVCLAAAIGGLAAVRLSTGVTSALTRDGVWHTYAAGVGQFPNALGLVEDDRSVRDLVERQTGRQYRGFYWQHLPGYEETLAVVMREHMSEHRTDLAVNALIRAVWLAAPGLAPSMTAGTHTKRRQAVRLTLGVLTSGVALLAILGLWHMRRRMLPEAVTLLLPWVALLPLCVYYAKAKVVMLIYFCPMSLAVFAVLTLLRAGRWRARSAVDGDALLTRA